MRRLAVLLFALAGCASAPPGSAPPAAAAAEDDRGPLERAEALLGAGDLAGTRAALEEYLDDEPEDPRARYLLARTLSLQGELRGARAQAQAALALEPSNVLAWDVLAGAHEALGEHRQALAAYVELSRRTESAAPALGVARCSLYVGDPAAALAALGPVRSRRPALDPAAEYLAFRALRRLDRQGEAETVARALLAHAVNKPELSDRANELRAWLAGRSEPLDGPSRQAMVAYVRAACRLRLPGRGAPEEAVLDQAPARLYAFDERPVFVTLLGTPAATPPFGVGRGSSLAAALKGAVEALARAPGFAEAQPRDPAIRVDIGRQLERITVRWRDGQLVAEPALTLGVHGVALRADGREAYCLPGDPLALDLPDLTAMLEHASRRAELAPDAWQSAGGAVWRFESDAFVSPAPGAAPLVLRNSEPGPTPLAAPSDVLDAGTRGARFLSRLLLPEGRLAAGYDAAHDAFDAVAGDGEQVVEADGEDAAEAAHALALWGRRLPAGRGGSSLRAGARMLADRLLAEPAAGAPPRPASAVTLAWTLRTLVALDDPRAPAVADRLTALAADPGREPAAADLIALALTEAGRGSTPAPLAPQAGPLAALAALDGDRAAVARWAEPRLPPAEAPDRAAPIPPLDGGAGLGPDALAVVALLAQATERAGNRQLALRLREATTRRLRELLALQLANRHRFLLREPERALGGFRSEVGRIHLHPGDTAAALRALDACAALLGAR